MEHDYRTETDARAKAADSGFFRNQGAANAAIRGEVLRLAEELIKDAESVVVRLNQLQVPLSPILQPEIPATPSQVQRTEEPAPASELGRMLGSTRRSMREAHQVLTSLEQRLML